MGLAGTNFNYYGGTSLDGGGGTQSRLGSVARPGTRALNAPTGASFLPGRRGGMMGPGGGIGNTSIANAQFSGTPAQFGGGPQAGGPQLPYQPSAPQANAMIGSLQNAGQGLLDPNSDYFKNLSSRLSEEIGGQTEAQQRAAALRAARSGLGMGASPELMSTQAEIGRTGLEQQGQAGADLALQAPQLGASMLSPALSGAIGLQGQALSGYMGQQGLQAQQQSQQLQANLQAQQMQQEAMLRQLALLFGGMF